MPLEGAARSRKPRDHSAQVLVVQATPEMAPRQEGPAELMAPLLEVAGELPAPLQEAPGELVAPLQEAPHNGEVG